jgi:hypothetical protein
MTIRGGGDSLFTMAFKPRSRMDPPPRSSPPMRVIASWCDPRKDRPNTRMRRDQRLIAGLASDFVAGANAAVHVTSCSRVRRRQKMKISRPNWWSWGF